MLISQPQLEMIVSQAYRLYQDQDFDGAAILFRGLTAVARDTHYGWAGLGAIDLAKDPPDLDGAVHNLRVAVGLKPDEPALLANLGEALLRKGMLQESAAEFEKAMELDPEKKDPSVNRARAIIEALRVATEELQKMSQASTPETIPSRPTPLPNV